jgi:hypothetical protein
VKAILLALVLILILGLRPDRRGVGSRKEG